MDRKTQNINYTEYAIEWMKAHETPLRQTRNSRMFGKTACFHQIVNRQADFR